MYNIGDIVVYRKDICKVKDIKKSSKSNTDYYVLTPLDDDSLTISVPTDNKMGWLRDVISKEQALLFINKIPEIDIIKSHDKNYENEYKKLLVASSLENLVKIIKTTYIRNDLRIQNKKKISETDDAYFKRAEKQLYSELSISLGMTYDETKNYIVNCCIQKEHEA